MSHVLSYLFIYYMFIDSQRDYLISHEKMAPFWAKSRALFYYRLLNLTLKNQWILPLTGIIFVTIGMMLYVFEPFMLILLCLIYLFNCLLQHHKIYAYVKYILYLLPILPLMLEQIGFVYLIISVIVVINTYFLVSFRFDMYKRHGLQLPRFKVKNYAACLVFGGSLLCVGVLLALNHYRIPLPLEEAFTTVAFFLVIVMELDVSKNKMFALRMRSRFDLVRSKSIRLNFAFLLPKQKYEIFVILGASLLTSIIFGLLRGDYLASVLIFCGIGLYFLYVIDYIIWHVLLAQSIVYDNKVVSEFIKMLLSSVVFIYLITFTATKYMNNLDILPNNSTVAEFFNLFGGIQAVYALCYSVLFGFFIFRLEQTFIVNNKSLKEERTE